VSKSFENFVSVNGEMGIASFLDVLASKSCGLDQKLSFATPPSQLCLPIGRSSVEDNILKIFLNLTHLILKFLSISDALGRVY
jgi:hypothetical protein